MAITREGVRFLAEAAWAGTDFSTTCMIGRQHLYAGERALRQVGLDPALAREEFADGVFRALGATQVDALDYSHFEGATIVHDLNSGQRPDGQFSVVVEAGTLEHVFHVPNALATIMSLVQPGGHLIAISPTDGHSGHGFYQFSPEFWFRALNPGFDVERVRLHEVTRGWFDVADPATLGRRVEVSSTGAYLYVLARRTAGAVLASPPLQSDYQVTWARGAVAPSRRALGALPDWAKASLRRLRPRRPGLTRVRAQRQ